MYPRSDDPSHRGSLFVGGERLWCPVCARTESDGQLVQAINSGCGPAYSCPSARGAVSRALSMRLAASRDPSPQRSQDRRPRGAGRHSLANGYHPPQARSGLQGRARALMSEMMRTAPLGGVNMTCPAPWASPSAMHDPNSVRSGCAGLVALGPSVVFRSRWERASEPPRY